jgi:protein SCO1/2
MKRGQIRRRQMLVLLLGSAGGCSRKQEPEQPVRRYEMRGKVIRLQPSSQIAVIQHEKIEGWMEAMTMDFPVRDKEEFAKLRDGMRIRATVLVQDLDYWLTEIRPE